MKTVKLFAVSDIHGHYTELKQALDAAGFEKNNAAHMLVCCGDLFDRGTENYKVFRFFEDLENCVLIKGNHEDMLMQILDECLIKPHNYHNGTDKTLTEFFGKYAITPGGTVDTSGNWATEKRLRDFIGSMKDYYETEHYIFTHGWLPVDMVDRKPYIINNWRNANDESWQDARWISWLNAYECTVDKTIVCGHLTAGYAVRLDALRAPDDYSVYYGNGFIAIDGGTVLSHKVNVLVLDNETVMD